MGGALKAVGRLLLKKEQLHINYIYIFSVRASSLLCGKIKSPYIFSIEKTKGKCANFCPWCFPSLTDLFFHSTPKTLVLAELFK